MPSTLIEPHHARLEHENELDLRQRGYVPLTSYDAPFSTYDQLLPPCQVHQTVPDVPRHGRLVWSHAGSSGLDPRAVAPLVLVRVADGLGEDPLDPPLDLGQAARWLLTADINQWLTRPTHRVLAGHDERACLFELNGPDGRCLRHLEWDEQGERVARALGVKSGELCRAETWLLTPRAQWRGASPPPGHADLATISKGALNVTRKLAGWHRLGITGSTAWELAQNGVSSLALLEWRKAGFTVEDAAVWCRHAEPATSAECRRDGVVPIARVRLAPAGVVPGGRGLDWYAKWGRARHGLPHAVVTCQFCGAGGDQHPCHTCVAEGRTEPVPADEWVSYKRFEALGKAYAAGDPGDPIACDDPKCLTPVSLSVTDEGASQ